ncbi:unnamed protein product [Effrenium voratum]|nr:unnamed protein product [Effrenium voratum]
MRSADCACCTAGNLHVETIEETAHPEVETHLGETENKSSGMSTPSDAPAMTDHVSMLIEDDHLVRGISIHATLRSGGSLWKKSPCDMTEAEKVGLWQKSRRVDEFDIFLSHAWVSSGRAKFLALLFYTGSGYSFLFWAIALVCASGLCMCDVLPMPFVLPLELPEFSGDCPLGLWMLVFSSMAQLAGLALSPYLPHRKCDCFLDVVSINQHDPALTSRGIYALGGFLSRSKELRILWSAPLFTRLWCVFELAAFCAVNPSGRIQLMPQYFVAIALLSMVSMMALPMVLWGMRLGIDFGWLHLPFTFAALLGSIHFGRRVSLQKQSLIEQLESFTLDGAECRLESDRGFIYEAVTQWYGGLDQFTELVRGPLRRQLLQCCSQIPAELLLFLVLPLVAYKAELLLAMWKGGVPGNILIAYCCSAILGLGVLWTAFASSVCLCLVDFLAKPIRSGVAWDFFQSLAISVLTVFPFYSGNVLEAGARKGDAILIATWAALLCLCVAWFCWAASAGRLTVLFPLQWKIAGGPKCQQHTEK